MQIKLKQPLECIKKPGLLDFDIENRNGVFVLMAGKFKQLIKKSEYDLIMAASGEGKPVIAEEVKAKDIPSVNPAVTVQRGRPRGRA